MTKNTKGPRRPSGDKPKGQAPPPAQKPEGFTPDRNKVQIRKNY